MGSGRPCPRAGRPAAAEAEHGRQRCVWGALAPHLEAERGQAPGTWASLVAQWLGLHSQRRGLGSIPSQGTRSHMLQLEIPSATAKTQHRQTENNLKTRLQGLRRHAGRRQAPPCAPAVQGLPSWPPHWGAALSCTGGRRPVFVLSGAVHASTLWAGETHTQSPH